MKNFYASRIRKVLTSLALVMLVGLGACAHQKTPQTAAVDPSVNDPLESYNRTVMGINEVVDKAVLRPVAVGYRYIVPDIMRQGVRNALRNLRSPVIVANQALQADWDGTGISTGRFVVNSTVGVAGLIDVASTWGWAHEEEDFGQTLGKWGVAPGPYIVLPLMGPTNVRDLTGRVVDTVTDPVRITATGNDAHEWLTLRTALEILDAREQTLEVVEDLRRNSLDYYSSVRSIYTQQRESMIADGVVDFPSYDDE